MYTRCPHCTTVYPVTATLMAQARGRMACGACELEFDALDCLSDAANAFDGHARRSTDVPRLALQESVQPDLFEAAFFPDPASTRPATTAPSFAVAARRAPAGPSARWAAVAALLGVSLLLQIVFAQRDELAQEERWRGWLDPLCARLGCSLPAWRDPDALSLTARDIAPHPSVPDALLVTATLQNDADWPQAWPLLELALSDLDGNPVGLRRFTAEEYLGGPPAQSTLAPGQSAMARLEIEDPGKQAVAFAFEFR
jgi:predicted Zn finger-like uncharacterized protein